MTETPMTEALPRHRGVRRMKGLVAAFAIPVLALTAAGVGLTSTMNADAATLATTNGAGGYASTFTGDDGANAYCIQPGNSDPTSAGQFLSGAKNMTVPGNGYGGPVTLSDAQSAQINYVISTYGSSGDAGTRAATAIVVKNIVSAPWEYNVLRSAGYPGASGDVAAETAWTFPGGNSAAGATAAQIQANLASVQVGSTGVDGNPGDVSGSFDVNQADNYKGTLNLATTGDTSGTWKVSLTNGAFTGSGKATGTFPANGSATLSESVVGVPPSPGADYKISASFTYTAPGKTGSNGWKPTLNVSQPNDATQYVASGTGQAIGTGGDKSASGNASDPQPRTSAFSPEVQTQTASRYYVGGDTPTDNITMSLGKNADGSTNEWPKSNSGVYAPIAVSGTLYGPFETQPAQAASIPSGAQAAGHGTVTAGGTTANPTTSKYTITSDTKLEGDQAKASGYYVWVEDISGSNQPATVVPWLDGAKSYRYQTDFGIADESFVSPPKVTTKANTTTGITTPISGTDVPTTGLGLKVTDNIIVTGNVQKDAGFYVVNRHYTFPATIGANGDLVAPANPVCDASTLDFTSAKVAIANPGTYKTSFQTTKNGVGTWVETLYTPEGTALSAGSCNDHDEWTAVKQLLVTTKASSNRNGVATDKTTLWGTVPSGSQIAWTLYAQSGAKASDSDKALTTAGPVGLNEGLVNGLVITSPEVKYDKTVPTAYFVESIYDLDQNVIDQGQRGVSAETITSAPSTPTGNGGNGANAGNGGAGAAAADLPIVSG